jgi:hypothetical protein
MLRQLGDVRSNAARLIAGEQVRRRPAAGLILEIGLREGLGAAGTIHGDFVTLNAAANKRPGSRDLSPRAGRLDCLVGDGRMSAQYSDSRSISTARTPSR